MTDKLQTAKDSFEEAKAFYAEQHEQIREDLEFSNPANPKQWHDDAIRDRRSSGRPHLTFDYTNQYIMQVVNDQRMNKPGLNAIPVGSGSDIEVAHALEGLFRHIEYASRAGIAYDTSIENAARVGLGWLRVVPEVVDYETNEQEIRIKRVHDSTSVMLDPGSTEPDGCDAMCGHVEAAIGKKQFKSLYPKSKIYDDKTDGWYGKDDLRVCEYFEVALKKQNRLIIEGPERERMTLSESEYWQMVKVVGFQPQVLGQYMAEVRTVEWLKYYGEEILEETIFPADYIPLIPTMGYEVWIDGKRYLCGLTRRMMDGQRAYNVARTAETELVMMSPKQPFLAVADAIEPFKNQWASANTSSQAYLPWKAYDDEQRPLPMPQRQMPAQVSPGYLQLSQASLGDIEASVGMYRANLGQASNETSGKAINARQRQGSIANYHYVDNQSRSIEHVGRIIMTMIPKIYDVRRMVQIMGEDGEAKSITIDPEMTQAVQKRGAEIIAINPNIGRYDVRVKVGPGYATMRQEASEMLGQIMQGNPAFAAVVGPIWARMQDWPEADKMARMLMAMAPPQVQAAAEDGEEQELPPQVTAKLQQQEQQLQQAMQMVQQLQGALQEAEAKTQAEQQQLVMHIQADQVANQQQIDADLMLERMKSETQLAVTEANNQNKLEIEELKAKLQMLIQSMQPPQVVSATNE